MSFQENELGQPIGDAVPDWRPAQVPPRTVMEGRYARVEPIVPARHAGGLFRAYREDRQGSLWTYLPYGPFDGRDAFHLWMAATCLGDDPLFHAIIDRRTDQAVGMAGYLRITPAIGVIEVGHLNFSPRLQRTAVATDAMYLMMRRAFEELGYRRYEWKCNALNEASRRAAERYGFQFEGVFRQATIVKGRNRDTAWYAIIDKDWPAIRKAFEAWLDPANFDEDGRQRQSLSALTKNQGGQVP